MSGFFGEFTFTLRDLRLLDLSKHRENEQPDFVADYLMPDGGEISVQLTPDKDGFFWYSITTPKIGENKRCWSCFYRPYLAVDANDRPLAHTGFQVIQAMINDWAFILTTFKHYQTAVQS